MKSAALYWFFAIIALVLFAAIYWIEININPVIKYPPAPTPPAQDAYDYFVGAESLDRDSDKWNFASPDHPPGYKDPDDPDDRYYSLAEQKALLAENLPMLAKIRQGLAFPFVPRRKGPYMFGPYAPFREEARLLSFASKVYDEEGDWNQAITCNLDAVQLGEDISQDGGIIDRLVDIACEAIGRNRAWKAIDHLTSAQARGAALRLESIQAGSYPLTLAVEGDKWNNLELITQGFRAKGMDGTVLGFAPMLSSGASTTSTKDYLEALGTSKRAVVRDYSQYMDRFSERCRHSYGVAMKMPPLAPPSEPVARAFAPEMEGFALRDADNEAQNDLLMVSLALRAYKLDHGGYPASLSQLAPAYLAAIPADPFAPDQTLRYRRIGASYVLYSVGPDGKDDGGKPIFHAPAEGDLQQTRYDVTLDSKGDIVAGMNF